MGLDGLIDIHKADPRWSAIDAAAGTLGGPRWLPWPIPGNPGGSMEFQSYEDWRTLFLGFELHRSVPDIVKKKFDRALKLHLLGWIDMDIVKAGELVGWTALELALTDVYKHRIVEQRRADAAVTGKKASGSVTLAHMLAHMEEADGLTDEKIQLVQRTGGSVIGRIRGKTRPALNNLRNDAAHGYPYDGLLQSGLIELLRDLIEYAYRDRIAFDKSLNTDIAGVGE